MTITDDELLALAHDFIGRAESYTGPHPSAFEVAAAALAREVKRLIQRSKRLEEAEDIVQELRDIQNGCPLPTWQEQFDAINTRADAFLAERGS